MEEVITKVEGGSNSGRRPRPMEDMEDMLSPSDAHFVVSKMERETEAYVPYVGTQMKPTMAEVLGWFLYGLCSYFVHTVLIPIVFPLIISQTVDDPPVPPQCWEFSYKGLVCKKREMQLYEGLTHKSIQINNLRVSALEWTSVSWVIGLVLAAPILGFISIHLDRGHNQQLIFASATALGALFCLPAGFFKSAWIFPPYIAAIVIANTIGVASHSRILGLMVRGFIGSTIRKSQFQDRRAVAGWLSLYSTAAGCLGAAIISAFTYHMLRKSDNFTSLWVVSIFSGLKWFIGIVHVMSANRPATSLPIAVPKTHILSIFNYPHASGSLAGVFFSSFTTMCIFTAAVLYSVGSLCLKPTTILYLWLTYFLFPLLSLPLTQPLQHLIKLDAVKMQLLGFLLSSVTSGFGFFYRYENWKRHYVLLFAALQSTATGFLHAFGRVLLLDCSPAGKEGSFSVWFSWVRAFGTCVGFAVSSAFPGNINRSFGIAFCSGIVGGVILIFGNINNFRGAIAAGHMRDQSERASPIHELDDGVEVKGATHDVPQHEGKTEV